MTASHPLRTLDGPCSPLTVGQPSSGIPSPMPDEDQRYSHQRTRHGNYLCGGHHGASRRARRQALYLGRARKVRDAGTPEVVARFKPKLKAAERAVGGENAAHD